MPKEFESLRREQYLGKISLDMDSIMRHTKEHEEIIDAALKLDPGLTRVKMEMHLKSVYDELKRVLENFPSI
jgi:DNA-binding GntR family transcriptional regulator